MARVLKMTCWPNFNGTRKKLKLYKKIFFAIYKMLVIRNSNKQIIYVLKMTIFFMLSYFSSTYVCESLFAIKNVIKSKRKKGFDQQMIAVCVSLRITII
jgi:hypothetical protein